MPRFASHTSVPLLTISMIEGVVVVGPPSELDAETTEALVQTVAAATSCSETVMITLDPDGGCHPDDWPRPNGGGPLEGDADAGLPPASVVAPGCIKLVSRHEIWMVDVARRRFCRSADAVDPRFVVADRWTAISAMWATEGRVTILTAAGAYVSATTAWNGSRDGGPTRSGTFADSAA